jgi:N-acetylglucosamine kinase-like BadF-type ATPase
LVIGIDGGQTSSTCALVTAGGAILAVGKGGPLLHLAAHGGRERLAASLSEAIGDAWQRAGRRPLPVDAIGLGLTGVQAATPEAEAVRTVIQAIQPAAQVVIDSDGIAALYGAHLTAPGIIVIAGTGSVGYGRGEDGLIERVGGWGWLVGDEGSALAIGRDAVSACFRAADGAGHPTLLEAALRDHVGVPTTYDLKRVVYAADFGARGFAALAPLVAEVAQAGDAVAQRILADAGADLAHMVWTLARRLRLDQPPPGQAVRVAPIGGAFTHLPALRTAFVAALAARPTLRVVEAQLPPVLGAAIMALAQTGAPTSTINTAAAGYSTMISAVMPR